MLAIFVGSPFRSTSDNEYKRNVEYARSLCRVLCLHGHAVYAPHLLIPQFMCDADDIERRMGMDVGKECLERMDVAMFGTDLGTSDGMRAEMAYCSHKGILYRCSTSEEWLSTVLTLEREWKARSTITENL